MIKRRAGQYESNVPNYKVTDQSAHLIKIHGQTSWALNKEKTKPSYLDVYTNRVKAYGGKNIAPGDYPWDKQPIEGKTTKRYLWDKEKRKTFLEEIQRTSKLLKGPLDYKPERKYKIPGSYTIKTEKGQFMSEVSFMSQQSPGPVTYNPNPEMKSEMKRSPKAHLNRCASERPILMPFKKIDGPSPLSYSVEKSWKRLSQI